MKEYFSDFESLGFQNLDDLQIYKDNSPEYSSKKKIYIKNTTDNNINNLLFDKKVICPVCKTDFFARSVKVSAPRIQSRDSDFFIRYYVINPYFYDVWICPKCGYSALKVDFNKIRSYQIEPILKNITSQWNKKTYPDIYDENIAIERYKMALLNSIIMDGRDSTKAMICLKISWMYRLLSDESNEHIFLEKSLQGFLSAYNNEAFPFYGLSRYSLCYLIGELYRRTGDYTNAMLWLGNVITSTIADNKIKEKARDMRELIKETLNK